MNFLEAIESNKTKSVVSPGGAVYHKKTMQNVYLWLASSVLGKWTIFKKEKK